MSGESPAGDFDDLLQLYRQRRFAELEARTREALQRHPAHGGLWKTLGVALGALGRQAEALEAKRRSVQLTPADPDAQLNLANALIDARQLGEAATAYHAALRLDPSSWPAARGMVRAAMLMGRATEAIRFITAMAAREDRTAAQLNELGTLLRELHQMPQARTCFERALRLQQPFPEAASNLASTLSDLGEAAAAETQYRLALSWAPDRAAIHSNLGNLLKDQGRLREAQACYRQALVLDPSFLGAHNNLLLSMNHDADCPPDEALAEARRFGARAQSLARAPVCTGTAPATGPLRVGFVSGDLRNHPVGYFVEGWLPHAAGQGLELHAFSTAAREDETTARLRPAFRGWHRLWEGTDEAAARRIAAAGIDVLIDLSGHTAHNRLGVFAWRAAPVQASWLGYFATTGLPQMDWLLADRESVPPAQQAQFTERIHYLPHRLCFAAPAGAPEVAPLPALQSGHVTFGCFQALAKIDGAVLAAWSQLLRAVPASRLRLQNAALTDPRAQDEFMHRVLAAGIDPARVSLHGRVPRRAYLAAHGEVDLLLDTFPYPGGTTTCEALWMGLPTVTLEGQRMLSRQGAALLRSAGLGDWVAVDVEGYVTMAAERAQDLPALARLRAGLRDQVAASPLFDGRAFARDFAAAMRSLVELTPAGRR